MKIGLISDTHNYLDPRVPGLFHGVEHILHAGDVGSMAIVQRLEEIAPVTVVSGNTDSTLLFDHTEVIKLGGRKFLVQHIVDVDKPGEALQNRLQREQPDIVVFGHTHKPFCEQVDGRWFINPGSAGKKRFSLPRTVALLECDGPNIHTHFRSLEE